MKSIFKSLLLFFTLTVFVNCGGGDDESPDTEGNPSLTDLPKNYEWVYQYGSSEFDYAQAVTKDTQNSFYIAGITSGTIGEENIDESFDLFISKFNENTLVKTVQFDTNNSGNSVNGIISDSSNNIFITGAKGHSNGTSIYLTKLNNRLEQVWTTLTGSTYSGVGMALVVDTNENIITTGNDNSTVVLSKIDQNGTRIWTTQIGTVQSDIVSDMAIDSNDNIYLVGTTNGEFDTQTKMGEYDIFVIKYDKDGNKIWIVQYGTTTAKFSRATAIAIDVNDDIYVSGWTEDSIEDNTHLGGRDAFLTKLDITGNRIWTKQFGSSEDEIVTDIICNNDATVYVTGETKDTKNSDIFITKFTTSGLLEWTKKVGTKGYEDSSHIISNNGDLYIAGNTSDSFYGENKGKNDLFFLKLK